MTDELLLESLVHHLVLVEGGEAGEVPALHERGNLRDELGQVLDAHLELGSPALTRLRRIRSRSQGIFGLRGSGFTRTAYRSRVSVSEKQSRRFTGCAVPFAAGVE